MKKVMLVCNAGLSTSLLASKMKVASKGEYDVKAYSEQTYSDYLDGVDIVLVGPQVRYLIPTISGMVDVPVIGINPMAYGMMDGKKVLEQVIQELK